LLKRRWRRVGGWAIVASAALSLLLAANAAAAGIVVDTDADEFDALDPLTGCTLREAIEAADTNATFGGCSTGSGPDTITFDPTDFPTGGDTEQIDLVSLGDPIEINSELEIQGPGKDELDVVNSDTTNRLFETNASGPVTISGLQISGGDLTGAGSRMGAGILVSSELTLTDVEVSDNHIDAVDNGATAGAQGAGIYGEFVSLTIDSSVIEENTVSAVSDDDTVDTVLAQGAGIYHSGGGNPLAVTNSRIASNDVSASDVATIPASLTQAAGGGIYAADSVTIEQTTLSSNSVTADSSVGDAQAKGAGIQINGDSSRIDLSTIASNQAEAGAGDQLRGAGVLVVGAPGMTVTSSTIASNGAQTFDTEGANLFAEGSGAATVANTIVASPVGSTAATTNCADESVPIGSGGFNVEFYPGSTTSSCNFTQATDLPDPNDVMGGTDPELNTLTANGGVGPTMLPNVGSPVIDKGSASAQDVTDEDQRGLDRPAFFDSISDAPTGDGSDIGAVEVQIAPPTFTGTNPASPNDEDTPKVLGLVPPADSSNPLTVRLFTNASCTVPTGPPTDPGLFEDPGILTGPFAPGTTTTFYGTVESDYGDSHCSTGPFPNTITYAVPGSPQPPPVVTPPPAGTTPAPPRKKCKKGFVKKRGKCVRKKRKKGTK
jgi:CSLREA domain-containing protein